MVGLGVGVRVYILGSRLQSSGFRVWLSVSEDVVQGPGCRA